MTKYYIVLLLSLIFLTINCSKLKDDINQPVQGQVHEKQFTDKTATSFHGNLLVNDSSKINSCKQCHGPQLQGSNRVEESCFETNCHAKHNYENGSIINPTSADFHGKIIKTYSSFSKCESCHGKKLDGGLVNSGCFGSCHIPHKDIMISASSNFHSKQIKNLGSFEKCVDCHGTKLNGGFSNVSCFLCHTNHTNIIVPTSPNFHGNIIRTQTSWKYDNCKTCHGSDLKGGFSKKSCYTCHNSSSGPYACNTCHGDFSNSSKIAPPKDLSGNTTITAAGVGAHSKHLFDNSFGKEVECSECHYVPSSFDDIKHIDGGKAELTFGTLAGKNSPDPSKKPTYNFTDNSCSNVYCHGFFKNGNQNNLAIWNKGANEAKCGRCHGKVGNPLPGGTHPQMQNCNMCHKNVNVTFGTSDTTYTIVDKKKHVNGSIDF